MTKEKQARRLMLEFIVGREEHARTLPGAIDPTSGRFVLTNPEEPSMSQCTHRLRRTLDLEAMTLGVQLSIPTDVATWPAHAAAKEELVALRKELESEKTAVSS